MGVKSFLENPEFKEYIKKVMEVPYVGFAAAYEEGGSIVLYLYNEEGRQRKVRSLSDLDQWLVEEADTLRQLIQRSEEEEWKRKYEKLLQETLKWHAAVRARLLETKHKLNSRDAKGIAEATAGIKLLNVYEGEARCIHGTVGGMVYDVEVVYGDAEVKKLGNEVQVVAKKGPVAFLFKRYHPLTGWVKFADIVIPRS